jgi:hypothetical protein
MSHEQLSLNFDYFFYKYDIHLHSKKGHLGI